jgi:hypothetical protein
MALFVVRHQHAADRCPAQNPYAGAELLIHLSRPSAKKHGIRIVATIRARAADMADRIQPERAEWNRLGYGNNGVQTGPIRVV